MECDTDIVVACVVAVRRRVSRIITGLRRVRVRIIRGHRRIVRSTAVHRTLIILVVRAPVALFSRSDGNCILYALLCGSVVVVQGNLRERRLRSVMDDTILVCSVGEIAGRLFLSELLNSCYSLLSLPLDQLGDTLKGDPFNSWVGRLNHVIVPCRPCGSNIL